MPGPAASPDALLYAMLQAGGLGGQDGGGARGGDGARGGSHPPGGAPSWPPFAGFAHDLQASQNAAQLQHSVMVLSQLVQLLLVALQSTLSPGHAGLAPQHYSGGLAPPPQSPLLSDPGQLQPLLALMGGPGVGHAAAPVGGQVPLPPPLGAAPDFLGGAGGEARGASNGRWGGMHLWRTTRDILAQAGPQGMSIRQITQQLQQSYSPGEHVNVGSLRNTLCQRKDTFRRLGAGIWTLVDMQGAAADDDDEPGAAAPARQKGRRRGGASVGRHIGRGEDEDDEDGNGEEGREGSDGWGPFDEDDGAAAAAAVPQLDGPAAAAGRRRRAAAAKQGGGRRKRQRLVLSDVDEDGDGQEEAQGNGNAVDGVQEGEGEGDELPQAPRMRSR